MTPTTSTLPPKPSLAGLDKSSDEYKAQLRAYAKWWRRYKECSVDMTPAHAYNGTINHAADVPSDDRPEYLKATKYALAVDTETDGLDWAGSARAFVATASDYDRDFLFRLADHPVQGADDDALEDLRAAIDATDVLIFHNASFDIHMLVASGVCDYDTLLSKEVHDTDLLARIVLPDDSNGYGLKRLAVRLLDSTADQSEREMKEVMVSLGLIKRPEQRFLPDGAYRTTWDSYPDIVEKYALKDTRYTYDLFHTLLEMASPDNLAIYELERKVLPVIIRMEAKGTKLDEVKLRELHDQYIEHRDASHHKLWEANGHAEINPDSSDDVVNLLGQNGIVLTETTPSGQIRADKWILSRYKGNEIVDTILDYRMYAKFLSTYVEPMLDRGTVHPNFMQCGAWTGRMSCRNPNMQNIPVRSGPEVRSIFVPRDGMSFIVSDYSSIELRLLAYYMADPAFWEIIENGDPFLWLGSRIYGTEDQSKWPVTRSNLKNAMYAMTYGAGGPKIAQTVGGGMTAEEGRALRAMMIDTLGPHYRQLTKRIGAAVRERGYVRTLRGRIQNVNPDKSYVGLNALIQGSAADIMKQGLVNVAEALEPIGGYPLLVVHDEVVAEVPAEKAAEAAGLVEQAMKAATDVLPLDCEAKVCTESYAEGK